MIESGKAAFQLAASTTELYTLTNRRPAAVAAETREKNNAFHGLLWFLFRYLDNDLTNEERLNKLGQ